ncbi:hypothetical protein FHK02_5992 [Spirosoma sp. LMG 31448]|nr:hypothetical protein [Spirosoma utsteinense]
MLLILWYHKKIFFGIITIFSAGFESRRLYVYVYWYTFFTESVSPRINYLQVARQINRMIFSLHLKLKAARKNTIRLPTLPLMW